jgi:hypothetical protein
MWFLGALVGGALFAAMSADNWAPGVVIGGVAFHLLFRNTKTTPPGEPDRLLRLERQLSLISDEMRRMQKRLAALEQE